MKKTLYNSKGELHQGAVTKRGNKLKNAAINKQGQTVLNIEALKPEQLAEDFDLYEYIQPKTNNGKRQGKIIINKKTGTCTRELIDLNPEEIEQQENDRLRMEFEAEQEAEKEQKFLAWKAKKNNKSQILN